jgi:transposase
VRAVHTARIIGVEQIQEEKAELPAEVRWVESIPGIGCHTAVLMLRELDEVARFPRPRGLVCYAGPVPKVT